MNNKGFIFIETIIVISVLTVALMSLYSNYSRVMSNTKELNTFDTAEYNYKTYFIKNMYKTEIYSTSNKCLDKKYSIFSDDSYIKICVFNKSNVTSITGNLSSYPTFDAYALDYISTQTFGTHSAKILLVEYKKRDPNNSNLYYTYISSLTL